MPPHAARAEDRLPEVERLAELLQALSSPARLRILGNLRAPKRPSEIRVAADRKREGLRSDRLLSRPAISQHLSELLDLDLVEKTDEGRYVVNHQRLFSALRDVSRLAVIQPEVEVDVGETLQTQWVTPGSSARGPRLILVGGPREGQVFPLRGNGPWQVGRGDGVDIRLDYDPHVSREHLTVREEANGTFSVEPNPEATNTPLLDFEPIEDRQEAFPPGSVLGVGSSRLVLKVA